MSRRSPFPVPAPLCLLAVLAVAPACRGGCYGGSHLSVTGQPAPTPSGNPAPTAPAIQVPLSAVRRLSRAEVAASIHSLLGDPAPEAFSLLPEDFIAPFDNSSDHQMPSAALVEGLDGVVEAVSARVLANTAQREQLLGCTPSGPGDAVCLTHFIQTFGRRALRRPLTPAEVNDFLTARDFAVRAGDFYAGVDAVIRSLLEDVEFLYRMEGGVAVPDQPGVYRLDDFAVASRLSFFLWGRTPPDWLLDLAGQGGLRTPAQVRAAAQRLLGDPIAQGHLERFHAMWLGYASLPHPPALSAALTAETSALVDKVVFQDRADYLQLFLSNETWANDLLVQHYGLTAPSAPGFRWVSYAGTSRLGILSHGALLSNGAKQLDTSPTRRGKWIRNRLFCQEIPPPPPNVPADVPPTGGTGSTCKPQRYAAHANVGSCASCHRLMDPVGFGLENYDQAGKYRTREVQDPSCAITGNGAVDGVGPFTGADGLARLLTQSGQLEPCVTRQVFRFALGRTETDADAPLINLLTQKFIDSGRKFDELLLELVADDTFLLRRVPGEG